MRADNHAPVIYACVGMFRRWLGDLAGWWGSGDPIMRNGHTYGGDTYLSARLWELGFTVDWVAECRVKDMIHEDALRERNRRAEEANPAVYHKRYPVGPVISDAPLVGPLDAERLRVLYLPVYEPGTYYATQKAQKRGLRDAFAKCGLVWEIDYINQQFDLVAAVKTWQPDLLFLQLHSAEQVNADLLAQVRAAKPDMAVVNWCGDVWSRHLLEPGMIETLKHVDVQLTVNTAVFPKYELHGITARYWQCAAEPVDETRLPTHLQSGAPIQAHDVLILANAYSAERKAWGRAMWNALSNEYNVGFYGAGWTFERGTTTYDFAASYALTKQAKITCGDNQFPTETGFVSNRVFEALNAGGAMLIHQHIPGAQELIGLTPGEHFIEAIDAADMIEKVRYWLQPEQDEERRAIAARAQEWSRRTQSFDARVDELLNVILPEALQ
jgi:spore maturation protein CgeB